MDYRDDFTRCLNEACPRKQNCLRHILATNQKPGLCPFAMFECSDESDWDNQIIVEEVSFIDI